MTAEPDTIGPDVEARAAFASLAEHGYRHIPVVDDGRLVGIVSIRDLMRIAMIQPAEAQAHEVPKGLEGVVVAETTVGDVRGLEGFYHYRQYSAIDLALSRPLEDVWQLMFTGALPETAAGEIVLSATPLGSDGPGGLAAWVDVELATAESSDETGAAPVSPSAGADRPVS